VSLFYEQLEILKETGKLACFRRDIQAVTDETVGILLDGNEDWLLIDVIDDSKGSKMGVSVIQTQEITQVRWDGDALENLTALTHENYTKTNHGDIDISSRESLLKTIQEKYGYLCLFFDDVRPDSCFIGKYVDIDSSDDDNSGCILFDEFPTLRERSISRSLFKLSEITRIDAGAPYEEAINKLVQRNEVKV